MDNKKYKWGVSYNVFSDSLSTLKLSLKSVRESVDYVSVIYQTISNSGEESNIDILTFLTELKNDNLIDEITKYTPIVNRGNHYNEINKRNLGLICCEDAGCTHGMSMDSDELYIKEELEKVKQLYIEQDLDIVYCPIITYYKNLEHCYNDNYYVSLFYKITKNKQYILAHPTPITCDPTRISSGDKYLIADKELINMHHLSYVRTSQEMIMKLNNSSARVNYNNEINSLLDYYNEWESGMKAFVAGNPCKFHKLNITNIWSHFNYLLEEKNININNFIEHKYLINLKDNDGTKPHRIERLNNCLDQFKLHNIDNVERFEGVDGSLIKSDIRKGTLLDGEIGILLTHINIIKDAKEKGYKSILIFEDDVQFDDDFKSLFNDYVKEVPDNWDLLYLGGNHVQGISQLTKHIFRMNHSYAIHAICIKDNMYDIILNGLSSYMKAVDVFYAELHRQTNSYVMYPHLCWQKAGISEIQGGYVDYSFLK